MGSTPRAVRRLVLYAGWTLLLMPAQIVSLWLKLPARDSIPHFYHRVCLRLLGIKLDVRGAPSAARPTLFVSNHSSYLDIEVLSAVIAGSFVAKSEVATWPFFGLLAKLQRSVFIDRRRSGADRHRDSLQGRLEAGDTLILFPEGTSSDGNRTLPFKSALFAVASLRIADQPLTIQPVSVTCVALDRIPLGRRHRDVYAWYGDMPLLPHLWRAAGLGRLTVIVQFHSPVTLASFGSRKALADHCWRCVATGVAAANSGRLEPVAA